MQDRIRDLLGRGIPAANVALAVGCDDSYISQLMSEESFRAEVQAMKAANFQRYTDADDSLDAAEQAALKKVSQLMPFVSRPGEAAACFRILNSAKRRVAESSSIAHAPSTIVNISIPMVARVAMLTDQQRQIIEVDGRPLVTMPAKELVAKAGAARLLALPVPSSFPLGPSFKVTELSNSL